VLFSIGGRKLINIILINNYWFYLTFFISAQLILFINIYKFVIFQLSIIPCVLHNYRNKIKDNAPGILFSLLNFPVLKMLLIFNCFVVIPRFYQWKHLLWITRRLFLSWFWFICEMSVTRIFILVNLVPLDIFRYFLWISPFSGILNSPPGVKLQIFSYIGLFIFNTSRFHQD